MDFLIEFEQEIDGRWIAEIPELPGVLAYGSTRIRAGEKVKALALRVLADRMENESCLPAINSIAFTARNEPLVVNYSILRLRLSPTAGKARLRQSRGPCYAMLHKARAFCLYR